MNKFLKTSLLSTAFLLALSQANARKIVDNDDNLGKAAYAWSAEEEDLDLAIAHSLMDMQQKAKNDALVNNQDDDLDLAIAHSLMDMQQKPELDEHVVNNAPVIAAVEPVIEREITSNDYFEFGEINKILSKKRDQEMLEIELFAFTDKVLEFANHFKYGVDEATKIMGITPEEAQKLHKRILAREETLSGLVTNPADKETYIAEYIVQYGVPRDLAVRVYEEIMGD